MSNTTIQEGKQNTPIEEDPDRLNTLPRVGSEHASADSAEVESDADAAGDEDEEMNATQDGTEGNMGGSQMNEEEEGNKPNRTANGGIPPKPQRAHHEHAHVDPAGSQVDPVTVLARARLRSRANMKKRMRTPEELESEEDDSVVRKIRASTDSEEDGEDELDSDAEVPRSLARRSKGEPGSATKKIKSVQDLPVYAQHAYVASTYGLPKLPIPMVLLPGLRSRKPPPIPIPELTKRSRGRHVAAADDDGRKYHCTVAGCDKRFARGEHLKRHIRSIHTHEKPHQCPYPGCLRGFSRTDNMMQHMRTHDDWPDDEAAAQLLAEVEKKSGKKAVANAGLPSEKDFAHLGPMMPFPWQMHPNAFLKWAQQQGVNPFVPFVPPMQLPNDLSSKDLPNVGMELDAQLGLQEPMPMTDSNQAVHELTNPTQADAEVSPEGRPMSPSTQNSADPSTISPDLTMVPSPTSENPPAATGKKNSKSKSKSRRNADKQAIPSTPVPTVPPVEADPDVSMDFSMSNMVNSMMTAGMGPWTMPPGMQFPFMGMPPHMPPHMPMPPGMPFPPPAIAIPIPAGAPLPHPAQLPPGAQVIPDAKGGHTVIIPPPPNPWGMPFPPGMLPMPMMPGPPGPGVPAPATIAAQPLLPAEPMVSTADDGATAHI